MAIKYKVAWENDPVDIKYLEDRYYWNDFQDYETFTHWMLEHEKDGSVEEVDVLSDEQVAAIKDTVKKMCDMYDTLWEELLEVDGKSFSMNAVDMRLFDIKDILKTLTDNAAKLERAW